MNRDQATPLQDVSSAKAPRNQIPHESAIQQPPRTITPIEDDGPFSTEDCYISPGLNPSIEKGLRNDSISSSLEMRTGKEAVGPKLKATGTEISELHQSSNLYVHYVEGLPLDVPQRAMSGATGIKEDTGVLAGNLDISFAISAAASEEQESDCTAEHEGIIFTGAGAKALEAAAVRYTSVAALRAQNVVSSGRPTAQKSRIPEVISPQSVAAASVAPEEDDRWSFPPDASAKQTGATSCVRRGENVAFEPWSLVEALGHGALAAKLAAIVSNSNEQTEGSLSSEPNESNDSSVEKPASPKTSFDSDAARAHSSVSIAQHFSPSARAHDTCQLKFSRIPLDPSRALSHVEPDHAVSVKKPSHETAYVMKDSLYGVEWQKQLQFSSQYLPDFRETSCEVFSSELRHGSRSQSLSRETRVDSDSLLTKSWKESRERSRSEPRFHRPNVAPLDMPPSQLRYARLIQSLEVLSDGAEEAEQANSPIMKKSTWNTSACLEANLSSRVRTFKEISRQSKPEPSEGHFFGHKKSEQYSGRLPETAIKLSGFPAKLSSSIVLEPFVPRMKSSFSERRRAILRFQGRIDHHSSKPLARRSQEEPLASQYSSSTLDSTKLVTSSEFTRQVEEPSRRDADSPSGDRVSQLPVPLQRSVVSPERFSIPSPVSSPLPSPIPLPMPPSVQGAYDPLEVSPTKPTSRISSTTRFLQLGNDKETKAETAYREMTVSRMHARERLFLQERQERIRKKLPTDTTTPTSDTTRATSRRPSIAKSASVRTVIGKETKISHQTGKESGGKPRWRQHWDSTPVVESPDGEILGAPQWRPPPEGEVYQPARC